MTRQIGFKSSGNDIYVYYEDGVSMGSTAAGIDSADGSKFKIVASASTINITPGGSAQLIIDPATNGNITLSPNGLGELVVTSLTTGLVRTDSHVSSTVGDGADGQIYIGSSAGTPSWQNLTAGTGISITNGHNSVTINSTGGGMTWSTVTTAGPTQMVANHGYIENYGVVQTPLILPLNPTVGTVVELCTTTAVGAVIEGTASTVKIQGLDQSAQLAIGTSLGSSPFGNRYCCIKLLCIATSGGNNDTWQISSMTGNWVYQN